MNLTLSWFHWALLSALFTALTTILANIGIHRLETEPI